MKGYLVDTNIPSELTRDRPDPRVEAFLNRAGKHGVFLSVLTIGEICKGIANLAPGQKRTALEHWLDGTVRPWFDGRILPVTEDIAERWGYLASAARQKGMPMAVVDGVIAATALHHDLTLVTRNVRDFASSGVRVFNPWEDESPD